MKAIFVSTDRWQLFNVFHCSFFCRYRSPLVCDILVRVFDEDNCEMENYTIDHVPIGDIPIMLKFASLLSSFSINSAFFSLFTNGSSGILQNAMKMNSALDMFHFSLWMLVDAPINAHPPFLPFIIRKLHLFNA